MALSDAEALALLAPRQRQIMELANRGHDAAEISGRLGISKQHVWTSMSEARKRIAHGGVPVYRAQYRAMETPKPAQTVADRIQADIAAGKRCKRCWLLSPCDHDPIVNSEHSADLGRHLTRP
jgi:DNA-binding CsgD family transcriptional regulator